MGSTSVSTIRAAILTQIFEYGDQAHRLVRVYSSLSALRIDSTTSALS